MSNAVPAYASGDYTDPTKRAEQLNFPGLSQPRAGVSNSASADGVLDNADRHAKGPGVLGRISAWFSENISEETRKNLIIAAKVLVVAIVVAALITASVFTFGAAAAAIGAIAWGGSATAIVSSFTAAGALAGTGLGLSASAVVTVGVAYATGMFEVTEHNLEDVGVFLGASFVTSVLITGYFAASGASEGLRYGIPAVLVAAAWPKGKGSSE